MNNALNALMKVAEETLTFEYQMGNVTKVEPHSTGMRSLPSLVTCQLDYATRIESPGHPAELSKPGETICLPPGVAHNVTMISAGPGISRWSHVSYRILGSVDVFSLLGPPHVIRGPASHRIGAINEALADLDKRPERTLADVIRHKALGLELLSIVAGLSEVRPGSLQLLQGARKLAPVLTHIMTHLDGELGRDELAHIAHLSPSRFHTVFEQALGKAPGQYVRELRLHRAQQLLISSDLGVEEIGLKVGYPDPFHFSRHFKKHCGSSPAQYRRQARAGMA